MNILIVSYESWRETNNGGNVLSNIFSAFPDADIAQIYCSGEQPQNSVCRKYFQISDTMLLAKEKGRRLQEKDYSTEFSEQATVLENQIKAKTPGIFRDVFLLAREFLWVTVDWKTKQLEEFVCSFQPDIIFAPCYSYFHVSKMALHIKKIAKCPMISYISDDNYSLKQFRFSPFFWINRVITRKWIRKLFAQCSLVYTMSELQKKEYEALLGCPMKILCKSAAFETRSSKTGDPIQLIYAGGLYLNRWKVLARLGKALDAVNSPCIKAQLHIYSASKLPKRQNRKLNDKKNIFFHGAISYDELKARYAEADVAVHVEAFDLRNRLITRLSFSTKIIDCMSSGCAILAIGPKNQAGISYLRDNDAAICVDDMGQLYSIIRNLVDHPELIQDYSKKANQLGRKNHIKSQIDEDVRQDLFAISREGVL